MIRDAAIFGFLIWMLSMGLRRPWMLTFAYLYVDLLQPQRIGYGLLANAPVNLIFALLAIGAFFFERNKNLRFGLVQSLMVVFILWFTLVTQWAILPDEGHWEKWDSSWKSLGFAAFIPFVLVTRRRIDSVVGLIVLAVGLVAGNAALKTLAGGGGYDELPMLVPINKGIYESSTASTLAIAIIPLAFYLVQHSPLVPRTRLFRLMPWVIAAAGILVTVGNEARTGLICMAALALMLFWSSRRKLLFAAGATALVVASLPLLPQSFIDRMKTIGSYEQDRSASTRTAMWRWTLDFVKVHPWGGGFRVFRISEIETDLPVYAPDQKTIIGYKTTTQRGRAFHSTYFEVLGELGYLGLAIWLSIVVAIQWQLHRLRQRFRNPSPEDAWIPALSRAVAQAAGIYLVGGVFVGLAFQTSLYTFIAVGISLLHFVDARAAKVARDRRAAQLRGRFAPPPSGALPAE